jgi:Kef-type K+ transport system membrane component KefB
MELPVTDPIYQFAVLVAAALLVQLTLERLRLPGITGLLLIGMLLGPGGIGVLPREPVVSFLGSVGLIYIMFLAGLEIDLGVAREHKQETVFFGLVGFSFTLALGTGAGLLIGQSLAGALLIGTAVASHTLLAYPIVEDLGLIHRRSMVAAIGGTLLTDTLALILLVVTMQFVAGGENGASGWILPLGGLAALVALSLFAVPRVGRRFLSSSRPDQPEKALFALVVLLLLSSAAELIGTEDILGAFLAGVCLNHLVHEREDFHEHLSFVGRMLFIPFFFVETGMRLELEVFTGQPQTWILAGLLLLVVVSGKAVASWLTGWRFGYGTMARTTMLGLTMPQAAATLAVTVTAAEAQVLGEDVVDAIIIVIFLTCLAGPVLTGWAGRRLAAETGHDRDSDERSNGDANDRRGDSDRRPNRDSKDLEDVPDQRSDRGESDRERASDQRSNSDADHREGEP